MSASARTVSRGTRRASATYGSAQSTRGARPGEQLAELVAERGPAVVGLRLEGHPQDADGPPAQRPVAPLQGAHDVGRHPLVHLHRRLAHREVVAGEGRELHRVLEEAGSGGEARAREVGGARVVAADRLEDVRVVHAGLVGDHEELVGDGELHVAPGVREELGQLGFPGARPDDLAAEPGEERRGPIADGRRRPRPRSGAGSGTPPGRGPRRSAPGRRRRRRGGRGRASAWAT